MFCAGAQDCFFLRLGDNQRRRRLARGERVGLNGRLLRRWCRGGDADGGRSRLGISGCGGGGGGLCGGGSFRR
ncbi:hypothetical protein FBR02_04995 [Anaerolineae bacterium CFX9]|nr:hypothetical protein [Anaerolineae bacterium CFX9]